MRTAVGGNRLIRKEKIVLVGTHASGKTSLVQRFIHGTFSRDCPMTVGAAYVPKVVSVGDQKIQLEIWDTAGSERYRSLTPLYYRDARAAIVVFDLTRAETFTEATTWAGELREKTNSLVTMFAAANKADLVSERAVKPSEIEEFKFQNQLDYISETSALTGQGVEQLFVQLAKDLLSQAPASPDDVAELADPDLPPPKQSDCC
jgi:small GTP-binding protein